MNKRIAIAAAAALVSCGGSNWVDPTTGNFTTQDTAEIMSMLSGSFSAVARQQPGQNPLQNAKALTQSVTSSAQCPVSGTASVTGTSSSNCDTSANPCTFKGSVTVALNACTTQNLVGAGSVTADVDGSQTTSGSTTTLGLHEHLEGGITVTRVSDGSSVGICGMNVDVWITSDGTNESVRVQGSVCKQAVVQ